MVATYAKMHLIKRVGIDLCNEKEEMPKMKSLPSIG